MGHTGFQNLPNLLMMSYGKWQKCRQRCQNLPNLAIMSYWNWPDFPSLEIMPRGNWQGIWCCQNLWNDRGDQIWIIWWKCLIGNDMKDRVSKIYLIWRLCHRGNGRVCRCSIVESSDGSVFHLRQFFLWIKLCSHYSHQIPKWYYCTLSKSCTGPTFHLRNNWSWIINVCCCHRNQTI
jgi:hypothetical protein